MRLLVADDNKDSLYMLQTLLQANGHQVVTARNGAEALKRLHSERADMIISDILMPVMDGFILCREVKRDQAMKDIPFIFYTATYTDERDEELALKMGADRFIRKPKMPDEFIRIVQQVAENVGKGNVVLKKPAVDETETEKLKLHSERLIKKLEKKMMDLEKENEERKRTETALRDSQEQLRQAHKMEGMVTLAGGIAHEFNNILGIIIGNNELALMDVPDWSPARECLKEIQKAALRAKEVVRNILSFARKTPAERKPTQVATIVKETLTLLRASISANIDIRQNILCDREILLADPAELSNVLMNLCTNAVHAIGDGPGLIEVGLEPITLDRASVAKYEGLNPGNFVKLTVRDTGSGIDSRIIDCIFDPYFTTKSLSERSGMGLAIVYGIVKQHDGAIRVKSVEGQETLFEVVFPLLEVEIAREVRAAPEVLPKGTERILFVDDEPSLTKLVKHMLEQLGYRVETRTSSLEALALFKGEPGRFDLVITDMGMPEMAGNLLAQELMKTRSDIPIIMCTGYSARFDKETAKEAGIRAYAMKPLVMKDLAGIVRQVLDERA